MANIVCALCGFERIGPLKSGYRDFGRLEGEYVCEVCLANEKKKEKKEKSYLEEKSESILFPSAHNGIKWQYLRGIFVTEKGNEFLSIRIIIDGKSLVRSYKNESIYIALDELGQGGWELISTTPIIGEGKWSSFGQAIFTIDMKAPTATIGTILWFKRQID